MGQKEIVGKLVILRLLQEEYIDAYLEKFSQAIRLVLHVRTLDSERTYLHARLAKQQEGKIVFYCIFDAGTDCIIGAIEIRDPQEHRGQLYCWINEKYWGTGRFQEAMKLAAEEYFSCSDGVSFNALVDVTNQRSYHALKKAGFANSGMVDGPRGKQYELVLRKAKL